MTEGDRKECLDEGRARKREGEKGGERERERGRYLSMVIASPEGGSLIRLTSGSRRCLNPTHTHTHNVEITALLNPIEHYKHNMYLVILS